MVFTINTLDLFAGIGGFSLGLHKANKDFKTIGFCEIDPFATQVLNKNFPNIPVYPDVTLLTKELIKDRVDVITAGFPCQDLSVAGQQAGLEGARSGLFFETIRLIKELNPSFVLFENSPQLIRKKEIYEVFDKEIKECGYNYRAFILRADAYGYPHRRARAYVLAYSTSFGCISPEEVFPYLTAKEPFETSREIISIRVARAEAKANGFSEVMPDIREADGLPTALHRIKALGNSIVPEIARGFGEFINDKIKGDI